MILKGTMLADIIPRARRAVDVYRQGGRIIARKWPRPSRHAPTAAQQATRDAFRAASEWAWRPIWP